MVEDSDATCLGGRPQGFFVSIIVDAPLKFYAIMGNARHHAVFVAGSSASSTIVGNHAHICKLGLAVSS